MSFPVTINSGVGGPDQPNKFATFLDGTGRYQVQFVLDVDTQSAQLVVYKSTDTGATWAAVDASNGPVAIAVGTNQINSVPYAVVQVSASVLKVFYVAFDTVLLTVTTFTMGASPAWSGVVGGGPSTPDPSVTGEDSIPLPQIAAGYRSLDNKVVVVVVGDFIVLNDVPHSFCVFSVYDVAGDTWTDWADLGYLDYSNITTWDMIPCGIAIDDSTGRSTVFMQQVARAGPGTEQNALYTANGTFDAALDSPATGRALLWGAGGGGAAGTSPGGGGGGGEGPPDVNGFTVTFIPGNSYPVTVGVGGVPTGSFPTEGATDGGPTIFNGFQAFGGGAGLVDTDTGHGGAGGAGGGGNAGGRGGDSGFDTGGGGGSSGTQSGVGNDGLDGAPAGMDANGGDGGAPGTLDSSAGSVNLDNGGGRGGNRVIIPSNPPWQGSAGGSVGGGGGGNGGAAMFNLGAGGNGQLIVFWIPVRNTNNCRLFQQAINSDNSLGSLTEITEGAYPSRAKACIPVPISFDCAAKGGKIAIAFTGASSTTGRDNISVGQGSTADPVSFSFQTFSSGNGSNNVDSCPAVSFSSMAVFCSYISSPTGGPSAFVSRADSGSGFGSPTTIGSLTLPDVREFSRLQSSILATLPEVTFGRPTTASLILSAEGFPGNVTFTAIQPGVFGNLIVIRIVYLEGGADLAIAVTNGTTITLTIGTTSAIPSIPNISWDAMATIFNADSGASALATMTGPPDTPPGKPNSDDEGDPLNGGSAGLGLGQYFSADASPPPGNVVTADCTMGPCVPATSNL